MYQKVLKEKYKNVSQIKKATVLNHALNLINDGKLLARMKRKL